MMKTICICDRCKKEFPAKKRKELFLKVHRRRRKTPDQKS